MERNARETKISIVLLTLYLECDACVACGSCPPTEFDARFHFRRRNVTFWIFSVFVFCFFVFQEHDLYSLLVRVFVCVFVYCRLVVWGLGFGPVSGLVFLESVRSCHLARSSWLVYFVFCILYLVLVLSNQLWVSSVSCIGKFSTAFWLTTFGVCPSATPLLHTLSIVR